MRNVTWRGIAQTTDRRDLGARRQVAWPGKTAFVDKAFGDNIETRFCSCGTPACSETRIEHELGHLHGDQHVFFQFHHLDRVDARRVVPA